MMPKPFLPLLLPELPIAEVNPLEVGRAEELEEPEELEAPLPRPKVGVGVAEEEPEGLAVLDELEPLLRPKVAEPPLEDVRAEEVGAVFLERMQATMIKPIRPKNQVRIRQPITLLPFLCAVTPAMMSISTCTTMAKI